MSERWWSVLFFGLAGVVVALCAVLSALGVNYGQ